MYKRNAQGWSKHIDFLLLDLIILQISYMLVYFFRFNDWAYFRREYRNLGIVLLLADLLVIVINNSLHDVIKRPFTRELIEHTKHCVYVFAVILFYLFSTQQDIYYSRFVLAGTMVVYVVTSFSVRILYKEIVPRSSPARLRGQRHCGR